MKGNIVIFLISVFIPFQIESATVTPTKQSYPQFIQERRDIIYQLDKLDKSMNKTKKSVEIFYREDSLYYEMTMKVLQAQSNFIKEMRDKKSL